MAGNSVPSYALTTLVADATASIALAHRIGLLRPGWEDRALPSEARGERAGRETKAQVLVPEP